MPLLLAARAYASRCEGVNRDGAARGVVLGGGAYLAHGFHAGALALVAEATGFDARGADLIVGTSAGAVFAALLGGGLAPGDLLAQWTGGDVAGPPVTLVLQPALADLDGIGINSMAVGASRTLARRARVAARRALADPGAAPAAAVLRAAAAYQS